MLVIAIVVAVVFATLYISSLFKKIAVPDDEWKEFIRVSDKLIEVIEQDRADQKEQSARADQRDSMLLVAIKQNQTKYIINDKKLNDIPAAVSSWDKEQLRRAIIGY